MFGLSAALAGLAGCTFALRQTQTTPENLNFTILGAILFLVIMVIGGSRQPDRARSSAPSCTTGSTSSRRELPDKSWLPECVPRLPRRVAPTWPPSSSPSLLILLMFVAPFGIVGLAKRIGRRFVVVEPTPPAAHAA